MRLKNDNTDKKLRGAYYTPMTLAKAIAEYSHVDSQDQILEPSCGDGVFIQAIDSICPGSNDIHIDAVEIDEEAIDAAKNIETEIDVNFINEDFFHFYERTDSNTYNLIIGNPPYIRYQYMEPDQRERLSNLLRSQGMRANRLINAWVGFMVACTDLLKVGGTLSFIIPAEVLQVVYAEDLRKYLSRHYSQITLLTFTKLVFKDIQQEVIVFIGKKGCENGQIRIIEIDNLDSLDTIAYEDDDYQPIIPNEEKWTRYFIKPSDARILSTYDDDSRLISFSDMALVNVGVTTGNNAYFSLTEETASTYDLRDYTLPLIGRSSHASGIFFTQQDWQNNLAMGKRARLLVLKTRQYDMLDARQKSYIDWGVETGANSGYKCSIRDSWYSVPSVWVPDAFFLRRNNLYPKFVINKCGAISTDTMHRVKLKSDIDPEIALISYYNSIAFAYTELCGRSYGGGVLEILPKEVSSIKVLNPALLKIDEDLKAAALTTLDETLRSGSDISNALDFIDQHILIGYLGFDQATVHSFRQIWITLQRRRISRGQSTSV